jgi:hypothetical protein
MPFFHAKDIVKAQLLFAALDQEAVCIKKENDREKPNHNATQLKDKRKRIGAGHFFYALIKGNGAHYVKHGHRSYASQYIRKVKLAVLSYVCDGQLWKE